MVAPKQSPVFTTKLINLPAASSTESEISGGTKKTVKKPEDLPSLPKIVEGSKFITIL